MNIVREISAAIEGSGEAIRALDRSASIPVDEALAQLVDDVRPFTVVTRPFLQRASEAATRDRDLTRMEGAEWVTPVVVKMTMLDGRDVGRVDYGDGDFETFEGPMNQFREQMQASLPAALTCELNDWVRLLDATRSWITDLMIQGCPHRGDDHWRTLRKVSSRHPNPVNMPWMCACGMESRLQEVKRGHVWDDFVRNLVSVVFRQALPLVEA